ncbi:hypothetical protein BDW_04650 [Bdellovibrio bacteriovorus W]|nr:hypothetical protein BDW_04650 [Bdellovibrio bacteriovorus W]
MVKFNIGNAEKKTMVYLLLLLLLPGKVEAFDFSARLLTSVKFSEFTSISAGSTHTCGLTEGGKAYCWGYGGGGDWGMVAQLALRFR